MSEHDRSSSRRVRASRRVALIVAVATLPLVATPDGNAAPPAAVAQLYVTPSGTDGNPCTQAEPCATVQHAADLAGTSPTDIVIGDEADWAESIDGPLVLSDQNITLTGGDGVILRGDSHAPLVRVTSGSLTVSGIVLAVDGTGIVARSGAFVTLDGVQFDGAGTTLDIADSRLTVNSARTDVSLLRDQAVRLVDSQATFSGYDSYSSTLTAKDSSVTEDSSWGGSSTVLRGSRLSVDSTRFDSGATISASAGSTLTVTGSSFGSDVYETDVPPAIDIGDHSSADVSGSAFSLWRNAGVETEDPTAVVRLVHDSLLADNGQSLLTGADGSVFMAASALDGSSVSCGRPVVDGGYNLASDDSCGFTSPTSENRASIGLTSLFGATSSDVDPLVPSPLSRAVDVIPVGTSASFDHTRVLCTAAGVVGPGCDVGATELQNLLVSVSTAPEHLVYGTTTTVGVSFQPEVLISNDWAPLEVSLSDGGRRVDTRCWTRLLYRDSYERCSVSLTPGLHVLRAEVVPQVGYRVGVTDLRRWVSRATPNIHVRVLRRTLLRGAPATIRVRVHGAGRTPRGSLRVLFRGRPLAGCATPRLHDGTAVCHVHFWGRGYQILRVRYRGNWLYRAAANVRSVRLRRPGLA